MKLLIIILASLCVAIISCGEIDKNVNKQCIKDKHCKGIELTEKVLKKLGYNKESKVLDLRNLCIESIAPDAFKNFQSVVQIDLGFNKIKKIMSPMFDNQIYMLELDLNNNNLEEIGPNVFDQLSGLRILKLNFNKLKVLNATILNPLASLLDLNAANNELTTIDWNNLILENMVSLDVHGNKLTYISRCRYEGQDGCGPTNIALGYDWKQTYFDISQNYLTNISEYDLYAIRRLKYVNFAYNLIDNISPKAFEYNGDLAVLNLHGNKIKQIHPGTFTCKCDIFDCVNNCTDTQFIGCQMQLRQLILSKNELTYIKRDNFANLKLLEELICSDNKIKCIEKYSFYNNMNLRLAKFDGNNLKEIEDKTFAGLYSLKWLNLEKNQIEKIEKCAFRDLISIEVICLSGNDLTRDKDSGEDDIKGLCTKDVNPYCKIKVKEPCKCLE